MTTPGVTSSSSVNPLPGVAPSLSPDIYSVPNVSDVLAGAEGRFCDGDVEVSGLLSTFVMVALALLTSQPQSVHWSTVADAVIVTVPLPGEDGTSDQNMNDRRRCVWLFCRVWLDHDHEPACVCDRLTVGATPLDTSSRM